MSIRRSDRVKGGSRGPPWRSRRRAPRRARGGLPQRERRQRGRAGVGRDPWVVLHPPPRVGPESARRTPAATARSRSRRPTATPTRTRCAARAARWTDSSTAFLRGRRSRSDHPVAAGRRRAAARARDFPPRRSYLLLAGDANGPVVAEVGAPTGAGRSACRAGKYSCAASPRHLLEGRSPSARVSAAPWTRSALNRVAYAASSARGPTWPGRPRQGRRLTVRTSLDGAGPRAMGLSADGPRPGALHPLPRVSACRGGYTNDTLRATEDEVAAGWRLAHAWGLPWFAWTVGVAGAAVVRQSFATRGVAPTHVTGGAVSARASPPAAISPAGGMPRSRSEPRATCSGGRTARAPTPA